MNELALRRPFGGQIATPDCAIREGRLDAVRGLTGALASKNVAIHIHSQRVAFIAGALAADIGLDRNRVQVIRTAAVLHDLGKLAIPDELLLKAGALTGEEAAIMRSHSELGHDLLVTAGMNGIALWVNHVHERFDGRGYPDGLAADEIPLESRILQVADSLEAMTASRPYHEALPLTDALEQLHEDAGTQFDPALAPRLVELIRSGRPPLDRVSWR